MAPDSDSTQGGIAALYPSGSPLPILVAPSNGKGKNTLRMELIPVACWMLNDVRFDFGSSFVLPETKEEFADLAELRRQHPGAPLSVFGHADPVGDDIANKQLSGHRAESIYAVLVRDVARWEQLYRGASPGEGWGLRCIQQILHALGYTAAAPTGASSPETRKAIEAFQSSAGLPADGVAGPQTREKLFSAYMDFLYPEKLQRADLLAQGADPKGKGDFQGCSEFNPVMVFSEAELRDLGKPENKHRRAAENAVNRRVVVLLFRHGSRVSPEKWPCPRTVEGIDGCRKRFWSDGEQRRAPQQLRREFGETEDTFGCRFYHRLVGGSPCEGVSEKTIELAIPLEADLDGDPDTPDCVRLRQQDGAYSQELTVGDPHVVQDGDHPLFNYHFQDVPPGLYSVEVKSGDDWRLVLRGLRVTLQGATLNGVSFEAPADGSILGSVDEDLYDDLPELHEHEMGCC